MRTVLCLAFFNVVLTSHALAQLPACKDSFPISLLRNHSFEEYSGCYTDNASTLEGGYIDGLSGFGGINVDNWHSFTGQHHEIRYVNYNCKLNTSASVFDSTNDSTNFQCYDYPHVPLPLPDGVGLISIDENDVAQNVADNKILKSYVTTCLSQPLKAGETYVFSFYFGFGRQIADYCLQRSVSPYGIAVFGRQDCPVYPVDIANVKQGCLANNPGWVQLGRISLKGENEWLTGAIEFTPQINISSIGIGPDCTNYNSVTTPYGSFVSGSMYFMDKFVLATKTDYAFKTISNISGDVCTGHFVLKAPVYALATYQWYKDGRIIPGATSEIYNVPDKDDAQGSYVVNINNSTICINSLPFSVIFSELNKFNLGHDVFLCDTTTLTLDPGLRTAVSYLWQDGSRNPTLSVNRSGEYWVQVTDVNGCIKKDSIDITIQNCDDCSLFIPSAFTPNNDGLNDLFKARAECPNISLQNFSLSVYNRWGQLVFLTNDINDGWDGTYRNKKLDQGVYVYLVKYSFKQAKLRQQKGTIALVR